MIGTFRQAGMAADQNPIQAPYFSHTHANNAYASNPKARESILSRLPFFALGIYVVTSIFYIFPSGNPQPADFVLMIGMAATLLLIWREYPTQPLVYTITAIVLLWVITVNATWFLLLGDPQFLKKTTFYIYNASVFLFIFMAGFHNLKLLRKTMLYACIIALFLQILYIEFGPGSSGVRSHGTFNNPNQLGYWALLIMTCLVYGRGNKPLGIIEMAALSIGLYITMISLSRSAFIAGLFLFFIIGVTTTIQRLVWVAVIVGILAALVAGLFGHNFVGRFGDNDVLNRLIFRLQSVESEITGESDKSVADRGYDRILLHPEYLTLGAGEGAFYRVHPERKNKEFHSSIGTILMSYGIVGTMLFSALFYIAFSGGRFVNWFFVAPIMLYGVTHMGLRFSLFWVFMGLVCAESHCHKFNVSMAKE